MEHEKEPLVECLLWNFKEEMDSKAGNDPRSDISNPRRMLNHHGGWCRLALGLGLVSGLGPAAVGLAGRDLVSDSGPEAMDLLLALLADLTALPPGLNTFPSGDTIHGLACSPGSLGGVVIVVAFAS